MSPSEKSELVHRIAAGLGFDRVGIARAGPVERSEYLRAWLEAGSAGQMGYLHRHFEQRTDLRALLPGARSIIVVALNYHQPAPVMEDDQPRGRVARYAWGDDYHRVVKDRLEAMMDALRIEVDEPFEAKVCVDTAPILEREWAAAAGVGWIGKNTMILHQGLGSYFFLGELVTTLELTADAPATDHCGSCTRCLEACPTDAFPAPYQMDASRCVSYLTIELRDEIPAQFHAAMGDWIFGCDVCQEVCPYNRGAPIGESFAIRPPGPVPALAEVLDWTTQDYRSTLRGSAVKRANLRMLQRNAAIALANLTGR
jgi:epoxyqueuosine reductase